MTMSQRSSISPTNTHEPLLNLPFMMIVLLGVMTGLHLWVEYGMDLWERGEFFWKFGFTPLFFHDFHITGDPKFNAVTQIILTYPLLVLGEGDWTNFALNMMRLISHSFLHGDWAHLGLNLIWLVIFGAPLLRRFGSVRFLLFWVVTAILSALTHFAFHITSPIPMVGASGVVSGLMAAAARYGFYRVPEARDFGGQDLPHPLLPTLLPMRLAVKNKSTMTFIGVWLAANLAIGLGVGMPGAGEGNIAWEAHIGGLLSGFVLIGVFDKYSGRT